MSRVCFESGAEVAVGPILKFIFVLNVVCVVCKVVAQGGL